VFSVPVHFHTQPMASSHRVSRLANDQEILVLVGRDVLKFQKMTPIVMLINIEL
jgi:hypothetical protein